LNSSRPANEKRNKRKNSTQALRPAQVLHVETQLEQGMRRDSAGREHQRREISNQEEEEREGWRFRNVERAERRREIACVMRKRRGDRKKNTSYEPYLPR